MADTPPAGGIPHLPTIGTLYRQVQGLSGQVHGARNDLDRVEERIRNVQADIGALRRRFLDEPAHGVGLAPERPSLAAQAALKAAGVGKWSLLAVGALGVAAQVAAAFKPGLVGPIQVMISLLGGAQ